jgi:hypothetical protein
MPNRILKESICTSDTLDELTWMEEVFWYRLIVNCDDYGRFDARPAILRSRLFPLKSSVTEKNVKEILNKLSTVGLVILYEYEDKPYLQLATWDRHQQIRAKKSKYPAPDDSCSHLISDDIKCPRNPIQSESNPNRESNSMPDALSASDRKSVITLILNDKTEFPIYQDQVDSWVQLYPAVDIMQELRNMKGWCENNPKKRKTKSGILRFVNGWLSREQNKGGNTSVRSLGQGPGKSAPDDSWKEYGNYV